MMSEWTMPPPILSFAWIGDRRVEVERQRRQIELGRDAEIFGEEVAERGAGDPRRAREIARVQATVHDEVDLVALEEVLLLDAAWLERFAELAGDRLIEARRQRRVGRLGRSRGAGGRVGGRGRGRLRGGDSAHDHEGGECETPSRSQHQLQAYSR
jgi:hypothetical protein